MIKGLYAAASAMLVHANRQQVLSHNIANVDTPGFKEILTSVQDFVHTPVVVPSSTQLDANQKYIGMLGLGSQNSPEVVDYNQGSLRSTGNPLDLALQGDGFFHVQTPEGDRYTRDGRFLRDSAGNLVTFQGYAVLDQKGQPIKLPEGVTAIGKDGTIQVDNKTVAQLGLADFTNPKTELAKSEGNMFSALAAPTGKALPQVAQGYLEMSNANPTQIMGQLVEVERSYEAAQQMVQNEDDLLGKTISILGRIS